MGRPVNNVENLSNVNVKEQQVVCAANALMLIWFVQCSVLAHVQIVFLMITNMHLYDSLPITFPCTMVCHVSKQFFSDSCPFFNIGPCTKKMRLSNLC